MPTPLDTNAFPTHDERETPRWRLLDWRYVLPAFRPALERIVVLGGSPDEARLVADARLARHVTRAIPDALPADAVVVHADAHVSLPDVARILAPGGLLYYEVDRRAPRSWMHTPARITEEIRRCGLTPTGLYWMHRRAPHTQWYLPLDVNGALPWYLAHLFVASTLQKRLIEYLLRAFAIVGARRYASLLPCYAVTAVRGPGSGALASVLNGDCLPVHIRSQNVRPLVLLGGDHDHNRVVLLPFTNESQRPVAVVKVGRIPHPVNDRIEHEQVMLRRLCGAGSTVRESVPTPLATSRWGPFVVGVESCADGRLLSTSLERWGVPRSVKERELHAVLSWLTKFHNESETGSATWTQAHMEEWVSAPIADFTARVGATAGEQRLFTAVRSSAALLTGMRMPFAWLHWGFTGRNIYRKADHMTVVDWEAASLGPSLFDLLYFVTNWYYAVDTVRGADLVGALGRLYLEPRQRVDRTVLIAREAILGYMEALRIDPRFLAPMVSVMWLMRALGRLRVDPDSSPSSARARIIYLKYLECLASGTNEFFSGRSF